MIYVALALLTGCALFSGVALYLGREWLRQQQREIDGDDPTPAAATDGELDDAEAARLIRNGPKADLDAQTAEWWDEQRRKGLKDPQIQRLLDNRDPILFI